MIVVLLSWSLWAASAIAVLAFTAWTALGRQRLSIIDDNLLIETLVAGLPLRTHRYSAADLQSIEVAEVELKYKGRTLHRPQIQLRMGRVVVPLVVDLSREAAEAWVDGALRTLLVRP
jgi:hypothetical protein